MELKPLKGQHHVSAITGQAEKNYRFYTEIMGMRLVKKTVNQDDTSVYHLFYADERGNPGTDLTFFELPYAGQTYRGTNSISLTSLRVPSDEALLYWKERFEHFNVNHSEIAEYTGRKTLNFEDFEGQRLQLVSDETNNGVAGGTPWEESPVPERYAVIGLGPVQLTVSTFEHTAMILTDLMGYREIRSYPSPVEGQKDIRVFETGEGGSGAEVHVEERSDLPRERPGRGSVHHVAFRVENEEELTRWVERLKQFRLPNSGFVERYYFRSLYFREQNGILFELATDGPGFEGDESFETLGETLALPPYLENQREQIEATIKPLNTKR
ncbi:ring-cleaving dioxygenase [Halalkalibacter hemicellulosilyticus]|uniref:Glyoxalase family protein n=1 Tax=Halalkalibacter hemicellulosilyticusJCM 9152 TaxID=1236971 RepID=W4QH06_9BACI|nr:ring-cleaving dioxygenase [Halalkalibacter hemicellulosilyticus]GAE30624.1 glyoxalase family protein [Halalkalibacter hemicellulosilyticusJCM 9152]